MRTQDLSVIDAPRPRRALDDEHDRRGQTRGTPPSPRVADYRKRKNRPDPGLLTRRILFTPASPLHPRPPRLPAHPVPALAVAVTNARFARFAHPLVPRRAEAPRGARLAKSRRARTPPPLWTPLRRPCCRTHPPGPVPGAALSGRAQYHHHSTQPRISTRTSRVAPVANGKADTPNSRRATAGNTPRSTRARTS